MARKDGARQASLKSSDSSVGYGIVEAVIVIKRADFNDPALESFIQEHLADMEPTAPAESRHALQLETLQVPTVRMWVAELDNTIVGTAALAEINPLHAELKSMRTDPRYRGRGIAAELLQHAIADARARGIVRISLETGTAPFFVAAHSLYRKAGFIQSAPFADYTDDPNSVFLSKEL